MAKVVVFIYVVIVLVDGTFLEVVGLLQKTNNDFSSMQWKWECIVSQVKDTNDFLVQFFSVVLMVLAIVWVIADFAAGWCFQSQERFEKLPVTPLVGGKYDGRLLFHITAFAQHLGCGT